MNEPLTQVLRTRREKLEALEERNIAAFAYRFDRSHRTGEAAAVFEGREAAQELDDDGLGPHVAVAGRMMSQRGHGKTTFAHLDDGSGGLQIYLKRDLLGQEDYENLELLDLGDWVGVQGPLFRTRTGEVTVRVQKWRLLAKSLRPLPLGKVEEDAETGERIVHSGFADMENRYRQRYADLAVNPDVRDVFRTRGKVITHLREFLDGRGFLEVETPALQPLYGGALARPFVTRHHALDMTMYLRVADELYLKRLIVGGLDRVYEIGKDFRNEGVGRFHNPEFTMLEFYQAFADYEDMMALVEAMLAHTVEATTGSLDVVYQGTPVSFEAPYPRLSLMRTLAEALGDDPFEIPEDELLRRARSLEIPELGGAGRGKLLDKLFGELVQPGLVQPTFVLDYPREMSPLAKVKRDDDRLTERFELFVLGEEVANAFSELNDPIEQRARFEDQARLRAEGDDEAHEVDEDYIRALEYAMPPTGGVGVGVDRLVMFLTDQYSIRDVILFPALRPE